ncbi:hypothetical protein [Roseateles koreensis]|uniref:Uncharacterized protein n=1 Tax=Roseateles koreensis TaxID=2987526 RepID=A0ABT5KRW9_9BURK|nr:hypothetical protein [Roseateles koreensis]MDC8785670.1 hypothetical protein [Roseateles koreensis]
MGTLHPAYRSILLTVWQQHRNLGPRWLLPGLLSGMVLIALTLSFLQGSAALVPRLLGGFSGIGLLTLWCVLFASLRQQNHPIRAHLLPAHLPRLRGVAAGSMLLTGSVIGLLLSVSVRENFGEALAWSLGAGLLMLLIAACMRWIRLSLLIWLGVATAGWWTATTPWRTLWQGLQTWYTTQPASLALVAVLVLPWCVTRLLQAGGAAHFESYRQQERARALLLQQAGGSKYNPKLFGPLAFGLWRAFTWPSPLWNWQQAWQHGTLGIQLTIGGSAINPLLGLAANLHRNRREQTLLMLLPGMPRGTALNTQMARRVLIQFFAQWGGAFLLVLWIVRQSGGAPLTSFNGLHVLLASLPLCGLLLRDGSRLPAPSSNFWGLVFPALILLSALLAALQSWGVGRDLCRAARKRCPSAAGPERGKPVDSLRRQGRKFSPSSANAVHTLVRCSRLAANGAELRPRLYLICQRPTRSRPPKATAPPPMPLTHPPDKAWACWRWAHWASCMATSAPARCTRCRRFFSPPRA